MFTRGNFRGLFFQLDEIPGEIVEVLRSIAGSPRICLGEECRLKISMVDGYNPFSWKRKRPPPASV